MIEHQMILNWKWWKKWRRGVVVITSAQLHSTKPELRFYAGSNSARGVSEIRDGNKAERLSSVNHTTKTIHHHHQFIASASTQIVHYNHIKGSSKRLESYKNSIVKYSTSKVYQKFVFQSQIGVKMSRLTIALFRRDVM